MLIMTTIFAPITADVNAPVALIRISGKESLQALESFSIEREKIKANYAHFREFKIAGHFHDNGLVTYFKAPHSFTGEDVLEFALHGSRVSVNEVLKVLNKIPNFRYAKAGEFSKQAFLNGKIDLVQAEGINDFIKSETALQLKQAQNFISGKSSDYFNNWRNKLIELLSLLEAYIDFPDEDLPESLVNESKKIVNRLKNEASDFIADNKYGERIRSGFKIAITGKPNIGKSTVLNKIAKREVAITSNIAGTTRDVIEVQLDFFGIPVVLFDTAGIREAQDEIEKIGISKAKEVVANADLVIKLIDFNEINEISVQKNKNNNIVYFVAKADLLSETQCKEIEGFNSLSTLSEQSLHGLITIIKERIKNEYHQKSYSLLCASRHLQEIENFYNNLARFNLNNDIIIATENIRNAVFALSNIIGNIDVEEVLDKIFSSFCIGK